MPHTSTTIFVDREADPKEGISLDDIGIVLVRSVRDLGQLCTNQYWSDEDDDWAFLPDEDNAGINKYARFKPNGSALKKELTVAERQAANCGIDCSDTATGCFSTSLSNLLARAKAKNDWTKEVPTEYRELDFDKYHSDARPPYSALSDIAANAAPNIGMYVSLGVIAYVDTDEDDERYNMALCDLVEAFTRRGNQISDFRFALIYRDATTPSATPTLIQATGSTSPATPGTNVSVNATFTGPASYNSIMTYDCVLIAYVNNNGTYWATFLPKTYFQAKVAQFYVQYDNYTESNPLQVPKTGGTYTFGIGGFNWGSFWGGKGNPDADMRITLTPDHGNSTQGVPSQVVMYIAPAEATWLGYVTKTVFIDAPGQSGSSADFTKEIYIRQSTDVKVHAIELSDVNKRRVSNTVYIAPPIYIGAQNDMVFYDAQTGTTTVAYVCADVKWHVTGVYYVDGYGEEQETNEIGVSTAWHTPTNPNTAFTSELPVSVYANLPADRQYHIRCVSEDGTVSYTIRLFVPTWSEA